MTQAFCGNGTVDSILYSCDELIGVNMDPFRSEGVNAEMEILPLCPAVFEVTGHVKTEKQLEIKLKQLDHARFAYLEPTVAKKKRLFGLFQ